MGTDWVRGMEGIRAPDVRDGRGGFWSHLGGMEETLGPLGWTEGTVGHSTLLGSPSPQAQQVTPVQGLQPPLPIPAQSQSHEGEGLHHPHPHHHDNGRSVPARGAERCGGTSPAPHQPDPAGLARVPVPGAAAPHLPVPAPHLHRYRPAQGGESPGGPIRRILAPP